MRQREGFPVRDLFLKFGHCHQLSLVYPFQMQASEAFHLFKPREVRLAWIVALIADGIQILLLPFFIAGALSPATVLVDFVVAFIMTRLLGWHWAFLPTVVAELFPGFDLFPTWTAAILYVTWLRRTPRELDAKAFSSDRLLRP
jgi:hypothetical protein